MNMHWSDLLPVFLLGFSSLLPLVNPFATAMIVEPYFSGVSQAQRRQYALRIVSYSFVLGTATLYTGSAVLAFMGVSIHATQTAGGIVIALLGYGLLNRPDIDKSSGGERADLAASVFYPISFPLTLGPGGISTLIALSAHVHQEGQGLLTTKLLVLVAALFTVLAMAYFCFVNYSLISARMGSNGNQVLGRLMAFLVFCIGIQMAATGVMGLVKVG